MLKNIQISILTLIILTLSLSRVFAQVFDADQAASWVKWRQLNTDRFQLIYPAEFEKSAPLLAHQINQLLDNASKDLKIKPRKISIILQENHIEQNGFAQLAPRKVEGLSVPGPASDNTEWLPNLIQHELRHIAQFDKLTGKLRGPFLEQLALAFYGIHLPAWYFEGDAVSIETQFSNGGRGRSSAWMMPLRANLIAGKNYNFDKNILGSFKDITPSYYLTGYLMNSYLTNHFGAEIKATILDDMKRHLLRPYNFNFALKKASGLYSYQLYQKTIAELQKSWLSPESVSDEAVLFPYETKYPTSYYMPQSNASGKLYALIESPNQINYLAEIHQRKPKKLFQIGFQLRPYFYLNDKYIIWDEIRKDARFAKQTYSILRTYDLKSGKIRNISKNSRFYSPIIDSNSKYAYAVQIDHSNASSLIKIDLESKEVSEVFKMMDGSLLQQPSLNLENNKIVLINIAQKGNNLLEIDLSSGDFKYLLPNSNQEFERPIYTGQQIVFRAQIQSINNLFQLDPTTGNLVQITQAPIGNFSPSSHNGEDIFYNSYQFDGYKMAKLKLSEIEKRTVSFPNYIPELTDPQLQQPDVSSIRDSIHLPVSRKYNPLSDFLNFHSLTISNNNFDSFDNYKPGVFWLANDLLNTSQIKLGYEYDLERKKGTYSAELSYNRYYPKFTVGYQNRGQIGQAKTGNPANQTINFDYREHVYTLDMQIPLTYYRGKTIYSTGFNFGTSYQKRYDISLNTLKNFQTEIAFPLNYQVYFNRNQRRSTMDLVPRWGQNISLVYRHVPFAHGLNGTMLVLKSNFYFPGFFTNHAFQARFSWQKGEGRYAGSNELPLVAGYGHFKSEKVDNTLLLNYRFPIAYPDWSIGPLAYIKRFHGYFFTDYQNMEHSHFQPASFGIGLSADFNLLRYKLPDFGFGTKFSYINHASARGKIVPTFSFNYSY